MDLLHRLEFWGDHHHPRWMDFVRIGLGIFLVYKGIDFLNNSGFLISLMSSRSQFSSFSYILAGHYVVFAHIMGGILLIFGVLTRLASAIQIPVLLGAVFFVSTNEEMLAPYSQLFLIIPILILLIYFLIAGNGPLSVKMEEHMNEHHVENG
jgi:putative oxidoreductase